MGLDAVVINNNPETVSTDYDACTRLYFEPLDTESVLDVIDHERALTGTPPAVVLTFGGQTAIDLAKDLAYADVPIAGLTAEVIEITEDRERFARLLEELELDGPRGGLAGSAPELRSAIDALGGLPVIVRPSWVIGGRGIAVLRSEEDVVDYLRTDVGWPLRVDELIAGVELDVDVISDGERWSVPGILEQVDPPGVHSGDSVAVLPPQRLSRRRPGARRRGGWTDRARARGARHPQRADDHGGRSRGRHRGESARQPHGPDRRQGHRLRRRGRCRPLCARLDTGRGRAPGRPRLRRLARRGEGTGRLALAAAGRQRCTGARDALDRRGARPRGRCRRCDAAGRRGRRGPCDRSRARA